MIPAQRVQGIGLSQIRQMYLGARPDAINLGLGEPGWALPAFIPEVLAAGGSTCSYGPNIGIAELREAIAAYEHLPQDQIMVSAGSQAALYALFQAWLNPGDRVLVPDPGFLAYPALASLAGAISLPYTLQPDGSPCFANLTALIEANSSVRMMIINYPSNPTGKTVSPAVLSAIATFCTKHEIILLSDEVYAELYLAEVSPGLRSVSDQGIVLSSISKAWGAPGLRVGWATASAELLAPARLIHNYMNTAPARPSQQAAAALVQNSETLLPAARDEIRRRWAALSAALQEFCGIEAQAPGGSFYYWLQLPDSISMSELDWCMKLRDSANVIIIPGSAFGAAGKGHVRISFGMDTQIIHHGIQRMAASLELV